MFSRDATTGEATVSSRGFETRQKAEAFAVTNRYKDYIVSTGQDLINQAASRYSTQDVLAEVLTVQSQLAFDAINIVITIRNLDRQTIVVATQVGS